MSIYRDLDQELEIAKIRSRWGCFFGAIILLFGPIIIFFGVYFYQIFFKETTLLTGHSPNGTNIIEINEKGQPNFFGQSSIKIEYDRKGLDRTVNNNGQRLQDSDFSISWENEYEAVITINGEKEALEAIKFNANDTSPFKENVEIELGSFLFKTSESPNMINLIELREVSKIKGKSQNVTVQIYYGERGSILEKYKEYHPNGVLTLDHFIVEWKNDDQVKVEVIRKSDNGETHTEDTIELDLSK